MRRLDLNKPMLFGVDRPGAPRKPAHSEPVGNQVPPSLGRHYAALRYVWSLSFTLIQRAVLASTAK